MRSGSWRDYLIFIKIPHFFPYLHSLDCSQEDWLHIVDYLHPVFVSLILITDIIFKIYIWVKAEMQTFADTVSFLGSQTWTLQELIIWAETCPGRVCPLDCPGSWRPLIRCFSLHPALAALRKRGEEGGGPRRPSQAQVMYLMRQMIQARLKIPNMVSFLNFCFNSS